MTAVFDLCFRVPAGRGGEPDPPAFSRTPDSIFREDSINSRANRSQAGDNQGLQEPENSPNHSAYLTKNFL